MLIREFWNRMREKKKEKYSSFWIEIIVGVLFLAAAVVLCIVVFSDRDKEVGPDQMIPIQSKNAQETLVETATIVVDVKGNVVSPGVYTLPEGSRVQDAVNAAGGFSEGEDGLQLNLAKKLTDGEMIVVGAAQQQQQNLININTAEAEELDRLPGIGEVLSQRILQYREQYGFFDTIEDLKNVQGIGNSLFEKIKDLITV